MSRLLLFALTDTVVSRDIMPAGTRKFCNSLKLCLTARRKLCQDKINFREASSSFPVGYNDSIINELNIEPIDPNEPAGFRPPPDGTGHGQRQRCYHQVQKLYAHKEAALHRRRRRPVGQRD